MHTIIPINDCQIPLFSEGVEIMALSIREILGPLCNDKWRYCFWCEIKKEEKLEKVKFEFESEKLNFGITIDEACRRWLMPFLKKS